MDDDSEFVLVTLSKDSGDEIHLEGFAVFEKNMWESIKAVIPEHPFESYYGSNEFVTFDGRDDYLSHITEKPVNQIEILLLAKLLNVNIPEDLDEDFYGFKYGLFIITSNTY